jgi:hypothetical protein
VCGRNSLCNRCEMKASGRSHIGSLGIVRNLTKKLDSWVDANLRMVALFSRIRTHNQKITAAARAIAERKTVGDLS